MSYAIEMLEDFKVEFSDRMLLTDYLRMNDLDTPIDYPEVKRILSSLTDESDKSSILIACLKAKEDVEQNRPHSKGAMKNYENALYSAFVKRYGKELLLSKKDAVTLCNCMGGISLNGKELALKESIDAAVSRLKKLKLDPEIEMEALNDLHYSKRPEASAEAALQDDPNLDDYQYYCDEFEKILNDVKSNKNKWLDLLCNTTLDRNSNDVEIENKLVYYSVTGNILQQKRINKEQTVCLIEPSVYFIRKWLNDDSLSSVQTDFVVGNDYLRILIARIYHSVRNANFISYQDYYKSLSVGPKDTTVIFAIRSCAYEDTELIIKKLYEAARKEHSLYILDADSSLLSPDAPVHKQLSDCLVKRIELLPQGINNCSFPSRKTFLYALYGYVDEHISNVARVFKYALNNNTGCQVLSLNTAPVAVTNEQFRDDGQFLRAAINLKQKDDLAKTDNNRNKAYEEAFTNEISLSYAVWEQSDETLRTKVYAVLNDDEGKRLSLSSMASLEKRNIPSARALIDFIDRYPYASKRLNEAKDRSIQAIISKEAQGFFLGKHLSLKTLLYIYPEFCSDFSASVSLELSKLADTDLGSIELHKINTSILKRALDQFYETESHKVSVNTLIGALSDVFKYAIENGHCKLDPADNLVLRYKDHFEELEEVTSSLGKRFFTLIEAKHIVTECIEKIRKNEIEYLGVLLRLFAGLETNVVSALCWCDFIEYEGLSGETKYCLRIERQIGKDGKTMAALRRIDQIRYVPVIEPIAKLLIDRREQVLSSDPALTIDQIQEKAIVEGKTQVNLFTSITQPVRINRLCLKMIKDLDIPENY